jgi:hypothetical protein
MVRDNHYPFHILSPSPAIYGQPNVISDSVKGIKCQPWSMGLWVSKERKRGRGEDRFWGWGAAMDDGEIFFFFRKIGF